MKNDWIEIEKPELCSYVGARFTISGWVDLNWFESDAGSLDWRMFIDYIGLDIKTFMGTAPAPKLNDQNVKDSKVYFEIECNLYSSNISFIQKSHGRITVKIASSNKIIQPVYLPLIVKQFEDDLSHSPDLIQQHLEIGVKEMKYEQDIKDYYKEMQKICESRKLKDQGFNYQHLFGEDIAVAVEIFKLIDEGDDEVFHEYAYSEEDRKEQELNERYKEAIEWRGPLVRGVVSQFGGFELRVYSNDHDKHFHVIHRGKGINARFSFPDVRLIDYKNTQNTISSKLEKKIRELCLTPEVFKKFEEEFAKRA